MTEITHASAAELAVRIRRGDLTATDVVDAFLRRIAEKDAEINAFVTVREEAARREAEAADRRLQEAGPDGPLHGVPVAIKDDTDVAGTPTTHGSTAFADNVPDADSVVVERLRAAGAIVLGKTNTPEFGRKPMTTNLLAGTTANPWDTSKTVGGSSGGSAAALAAGMAPLAQGSDAAGSLRIPASACGVFGFMPDFGRVPMGPNRADAYVEQYPNTMLGPLARTVEDLALFLDVVAGPAAADPYSLPERSGARTYRAALGDGVDGWTVAYSPDLDICEVDDRIRTTVEDALDPFEAAGATVERADPPFEQSWTELHDALEVLLRQRYLGMYDHLRRELDVDLLDDDEAITAEVVSRIEKGRELSPVDVRRAQRVRTDAYDAMTEFFDRYDLLVTPTLGLAPFEKETKPERIGGAEIDPLHGWALTWPLNLTGNPAMSVPAGVGDDGLPVGLQIAGPRLRDDAVLAAAAAYDRHAPERQRLAGVDGERR